MKKYIYLFIVVLFFIILILIGSLFTTSKKHLPVSIQTVTPTPFIVPTITNTPTEISATIPQDKGTNVPLNQTIQIIFVTPPKQDVLFSISPPVPFSQQLVGNILEINFKTLLTQGTLYTYTIQHQYSLKKVFSFTTATADSLIYKDNAAMQVANWNKIHRPDIYVYNNTPHTSPSFSVVGDFTSQSVGHFYFNVTMIGNTNSQSRQDFLLWIKSLGLTDQQIQQLDIRYH